MTSIWASTDRVPADLTDMGTMRIPVDTSSSSTPGYLEIDDIRKYLGDSDSTYTNCVVIGTGASLDAGVSGGEANTGMVAIGLNASAVNGGAVAIGYAAVAGDNSNGNHENCIAIGQNAQALDRHSIAIGHDAYANQTNALSFGDGARANATKCVAIGNTALAGSTNAASDRNVAIGDIATAGATTVGAYEKNTAIGYNADCDACSNSVAIGANATVTHNSSVAIGASATSTATNQVVIGTNTLVLGSFNVAGAPAASSHTGGIIYVTDGDAGSPCIAVSNGTNWLRISLGTTISAT